MLRLPWRWQRRRSGRQSLKVPLVDLELQGFALRGRALPGSRARALDLVTQLLADLIEVPGFEGQPKAALVG